MRAMASQIVSLTIVYSTVYSGEDQGKHQRSASLAFVPGIHRWPVNSPHKWPVTRKMLPFDDVIMRDLRVFVDHITLTTLRSSYIVFAVNHGYWYKTMLPVHTNILFIIAATHSIHCTGKLSIHRDLHEVVDIFQTDFKTHFLERRCLYFDFFVLVSKSPIHSNTTMVQVKPSLREGEKPYANQCWSRSPKPYGVNRSHENRKSRPGLEIPKYLARSRRPFERSSRDLGGLLAFEISTDQS